MSREKSSVSTGRTVFSVMLALIILAGSVLIMYPNLLYKTVPKEKVDEVLSGENIQLDEKKLGFESFPMYGSANFYGIKNVLEDASDYIRGTADEKVDIWGLIKQIPASQGFTQALYSLILISLISIPVYMLLRLVCYNAIFDRIDDTPFIARLPFDGLAAVSLGVSSACLSWVFYNTVLFEKLLKKVIDWLSNINATEAVRNLPSALAVNMTNIFTILILVSVIIALIKFTVFKGSIGISIFLGLFRSLVFILAFAFINVFIGSWTWRVVLFGAIFVIAAGLVERIFD